MSIHSIITKSTSCFLICLLGFLTCTSCAEEDWKERGGTLRTGELTIRIGMADLMVKDPMSSRAAEDFGVVKDFTLVVAKGDRILSTHYWDGEQQGDWSQDARFIACKTLEEDADYSAYSFLAIANAGNTLGDKSLDDIRHLKNESLKEIPGIPVSDKLFVEVSGSKVKPSGDGFMLDLLLERPEAMITVVLEAAENLDPGITIEPTKISLYNVPNSCYLGIKNNTDNPDLGITHSKNGESKQVLKNWGVLSKDNPKVGNHDDTSDALFLYENLHNPGFGAEETEQQWKRPKSVEKTIKAISDYLNAPGCTCPYLEIEAYYENTTKGAYGRVVYRLLLGEDVVEDFDIKRNTHYKITLRLSGTAAIEGGQFDSNGNFLANGGSNEMTWRVESNLGNPGLVTGDININATGDYIFIPMAGKPGTVWTVQLENNKESEFIHAYGKLPDISYEGWGTINSKTKIQGTFDDKSEGGVWIYAQPWTRGGSYDEMDSPADEYDDIIKREKNGEITRSATLVLEASGKKQEIKITQYISCAFKIDGETAHKILGSLHPDKTEPLYCLLDRVDRAPMPWGFSNHVLDDNQAEGFQNAYHLIDKSKPDHTHHYELAVEYLPWGQKTVGEDQGSAMIQSIQYHSGYPNSLPDIGDPNDYFSQAQSLPDLTEPGDYSKWSYYWAIPSIEEWQLIEKALKQGELSKANLAPSQYWSSDAVTTNVAGSAGNTESFTYQLYKGLDNIQADGTYPDTQRALRSKALPYRFIGLMKKNHNE